MDMDGLMAYSRQIIFSFCLPSFATMDAFLGASLFAPSSQRTNFASVLKAAVQHAPLVPNLHSSVSDKKQILQFHMQNQNNRLLCQRTPKSKFNFFVLSIKFV
jgi:hypothetical protein